MSAVAKGQLRGQVNHYALLRYDADRLVELAKCEKGSFGETVLARSAIILYIFALEALINRVIEDFWPNRSGCPNKEDVKKWSTVEKWLQVPQEIAGATFHKAKRPFQYFKPLFDARNDYVHAKADTYQLVWDYWIDGSSYVKCQPSKKHPKYSQIELFCDPSEWIADDAVRIQSMTTQLVDELRQLLQGRLSDEWLKQDVLQDEQGRVIHVQRRVESAEQNECPTPT